MQMYKSYLGDLTNNMFKTNKSKWSDRLNRRGWFLSLESCWSGAGSKKDPSAAGEVP
jgi:hypothetical protein